MITLIVDRQTDYFWELVHESKYTGYFCETCQPDKVNIAIIKTPTTVDHSFINRYPNLKLIIRAGTGYDNIDLQLTSQKGIIVCNTPAANTKPAFEHTISLILAMIKQLQPAKRNLINKCWKEEYPWNYEIEELKVLVVGVGKIGSKVAQMLKDYGAQVWGVDPYLSLEEWNERAAEPVSYLEGLQRVNLITYHCPLSPETRDYFSYEILSKLKQPVFLVNTARGGIVNEQALQQGLETGKILAAGLDVFVDEPNPELSFARYDNVYLTPHTGAYTIAAKKRLAQEVLNVWKSFVFDRVVLNRLCD